MFNDITCCHTPTTLFLFRDCCSACYVLRNILISRGGLSFGCQTRLIISGEEQRKSAMRLKTQVSFPPISFPPLSLLLALWHPTERQLATPKPVCCRMEMKKWKKWGEEWCKRREIREEDFPPLILQPDYFMW